MIERVSRYYDGPLAQINHKSTGQPTIAVFRKFKEEIQTRYYEYTWKDGDTLGFFADKYLGGSKYWWEIMELNPDITDPFNIAPGTKVYIPYGY
jgi:hypothetical protein